jgi:glycosyltransferase involved in cell wall biosynthesis
MLRSSEGQPASATGGLRVAIDMRPLTTSRAGVATYCRDLVRGFSADPEGNHYLLFAKDPPPADLQFGTDVRWRALPARLWLALAVPSALRAGRIDLFHGTNHMAPPLSPVPTVITIHDLSALSLPQHHNWRNRLLTVPQMLLSLRRATRIIAISQYTARDVARLPGIDPERIRVILRTASPELAPAPPEAVAEVRRRLALPATFFLFLGALEPRKNVIALVRALALLHAGGDTRAHVVIAGAEGWQNHDVYREVERRGLGGAVHFAGFVATEDLPAVYGAATAFVFPSLFEGFGLPPLEAMACGTPVICSNAASLPEVVGDDALLFDPRSPEALAACMRRMLDDAELRRRLSAAGLARVPLFSPQRATHQTVEVYREAVAAGRRGER